MRGLLVVLGGIFLVAGAVATAVGSTEGWSWRATGLALVCLSVALLGAAMVGRKEAQA